MKKYLIYGAILYLAAFLGDKQYSPKSQLLPGIKPDATGITVGQKYQPTIRDTANVEIRQDLKH